MSVTQPFMAIFTAARRLPLNDSDVRQVGVHLEKVARAGLDLELFSTLSEMANEGALMLQSRDLEADFLFVNVDAGRGFFRGQKRAVLTYTSDIYRDEFSPGPVLESPLRAVVGINNLYRAAGLLTGPVT